MIGSCHNRKILWCDRNSNDRGIVIFAHIYSKTSPDKHEKQSYGCMSIQRSYHNFHPSPPFLTFNPSLPSPLTLYNHPSSFHPYSLPQPSKLTHCPSHPSSLSLTHPSPPPPNPYSQPNTIYNEVCLVSKGTRINKHILWINNCYLEVLSIHLSISYPACIISTSMALLGKIHIQFYNI